MCSSLFGLVLLTIVWLANLNVSSANEENCYFRHLQLDAFEHKCEFREHDRLLVCFHAVDDKWKSGGKNVTTLILCHWSLEKFNPTLVLHGFISLRKLVIANGSLVEFSSVFATETRLLETIKVTGTKLRKLPHHILSNLINLKTLDLRNNNIEDANISALNLPSLRHVYLSGNPLKCDENTKWILDQRKGSLSHKIADKKSLRCTAPYENRPLLQVVEIIEEWCAYPTDLPFQKLAEECKSTVCGCELVYVVGQGGKHIQRQLMAFVSVNCSHRGLTEMPGFLPANTTTLRLTGNKIHDLTPLTTNPVYRGVIDLYLDNNQIESIVQLEGSSWVDHFRLFSLRGNRLADVYIPQTNLYIFNTAEVINIRMANRIFNKHWFAGGFIFKLPTYALQNVLQQNGNAVSLYLGNNPWRCDCLFTPGFQDLIIKYANLVKDIDDVRCSLTNGDDNSGKIIRDLTRTEICVLPDDNPWINLLDIVNVILASLTILIISKLIYDYWWYKKTGKLPWIITKMP